MTAYVDSHVHLADAAFADDVDAVVERARAAGARALVCIGESPEVALRAQAIAARFPGFVFSTCGVHPFDANRWESGRDEAAIRSALANGAVAVGECGLDSHYDHVTPMQQRMVLDAQLAIAHETGRPLVLHTRDAEAETKAFLNDVARAGVLGVLHCFTGSVALARIALDAGWCVSFSGIITFRSWTDLELLRMIPDDRILVESDAPYLAPVPHRGKRNEPAHVALTLGHLAEVRGTSALHLGSCALRNTARLFSLPLLFDLPNSSL